MKRILVPVDFSPTSKKAFRFAIEIAYRSGGAVILYHLFEPGTLDKVGSVSGVNEYNKQFEENSLKRLQRLKKKMLADDPQVSVSTIVGRTPVADNILGFAEHNHIDLIVMGTQGASGLKKVIIGSVAARIVVRSDVPVLLVPEKFVLKDIEKIVVTTNFHKADKKAFPVIFEFASLFNSLITLVNLNDSLHQNGDKRQGDFEAYSYYIQRHYNESRVQFLQMETDSVNKTMENLHKKIPFDMLAMARRRLGVKNRLFQKSFTRKMAFITNFPLLVVPEE